MKKRPKKKDRCEALARRLFRRWVRAVEYARACASQVAAYRKFGLGRNEFREALFDLEEPRGEERLWRRAKRTAVRRLQRDIETAALHLAYSLPEWGRGRLARAMREQGFGVGASTVRRVLQRYGAWRRAS